MNQPDKYVAVVRAFPGKGMTESLFMTALRGRPLVSHAIERALESKKAGSVLVCTAFESVAAAAAVEGAEAVVAARDADALAAVLRSIESRAKGKQVPESAALIRPEFPLMARGSVDAAIMAFEAQRADILYCACELGGFVWRTGQGKLRRNTRMDGSSLAGEVRSVTVAGMRTLRSIVETGSPDTDEIALHLVPRLEAFEIRGPEDVAVAERMMELRGAGGRASDLSGVRLLVLDFDGVMTDNRVLTAQDGTEAVMCSRSDGMGIGLLRRAGVDVMVLSTEENPVVSARCAKLKIPCIQGSKDKLAAMKAEAARRGLEPRQIAFVGNDVNDVEVMRWVGTGIAVSDAQPEAMAAAVLVTLRPGGFGAVREVADWMIATARS